MSLLHEREPIVTVPKEIIPKVKSKVRLPSEREKKEFFEEALKSGVLNSLTQKQQEIFVIRGYPREGPLVPFRKLGKELKDLGITTWQGGADREARGLRKLRRLTGKEMGRKATRDRKRTLEMTRDEQKFLLENPNLPLTKVFQELGHGKKTIARWRNELGVPKSPVGAPRRKDVQPETVKYLYEERGLSIEAIANDLKCSERTVWSRLRDLEVTRRPAHRPLKQKHPLRLIDKQFLYIVQ